MLKITIRAMAKAAAMVVPGVVATGGGGAAAKPPGAFEAIETQCNPGDLLVLCTDAVAAWKALSEKFGRLRFEKLFEPAVRYADRGFIVSPIVARRWAYSVQPHHSCTTRTNGRGPV